MDPLFQVPDEVGLEAPPAATQPEAAVIALVCPNCGGQNCAAGQGDVASVVTCPQCQCEFESPCQQPGAPQVMPMESGVERILGRVFERHVRRHAHALKRVAGQQKQPPLPGNAS